MNTVTIPKEEYNELIEKKAKYEYLRLIIEEDIFASPSTRNIKDMIKSFPIFSLA